MKSAFGGNPDEDVSSLLDSARRGVRSVELRPLMPEFTDSGIIEFLGDVSSFANSNGGHILYGVEISPEGSIKSTGINTGVFEQSIDLLRNLIADGIDPVLPGVEFSVVQLRDAKMGMLKIPASRGAPHMVVHQQYCRFLSRNSAGKYFLDVAELRASFNRGGEFNSKLNNFHIERIQTLIGRPLTVNLPPTAKVVLHMMPLASFQDPPAIEFEEVKKSHLDFLRPMEARGISSHFNWDGLIVFSSIEKYAYSHVQLFRNGCLEACEGSMLEQKADRKVFPSNRFEPEIITCGNRFIELLRRLKIEPPYVTRLSFLGVRGYSMFVGPMRWQSQIHAVERDHLFLDDVIIESSDTNFSHAMRPAFDRVWNACGWAKSLNYDENGNWREFNF